MREGDVVHIIHTYGFRPTHRALGGSGPLAETVPSTLNVVLGLLAETGPTLPGVCLMASPPISVSVSASRERQRF